MKKNSKRKLEELRKQANLNKKKTSISKGNSFFNSFKENMNLVKSKFTKIMRPNKNIKDTVAKLKPNKLKRSKEESKEVLESIPSKTLSFLKKSKDTLKDKGNKYNEKISKKFKLDKNLVKYSTLGVVSLALILGFSFGLSNIMEDTKENISLAASERNVVEEGYIVLLNGREVGVTKDKEEVKLYLSSLESAANNNHDVDVQIGADLKFLKRDIPKYKFEESRNLKGEIRNRIDYEVKGYRLLIDGREVGIFENRAEIDEALEGIKARYIKEDIEYAEIDFLEEIEIESGFFKMSSFLEIEDIEDYLVRGTDENKIHVVERGDTISQIAAKYGLTTKDIEEANPEIADIHRIQIDQELNLVVPKPFVTVRTKQYVEKTVEIAFDTENQETKDLYQGDRRIAVQGQSGQREIKGYIIEENGKESDLVVQEENIIKEPVTRVVQSGTTPRPPTVATGSFSNPTWGNFTSGFGMRWGRMHNGIDVAGPVGRNITAADAGRVEFAGRRGAYGNLVIINHENGYQTYYAHLSSINVSRGQRVHKGEVIGGMGSTGNSTGSHLHFEVRRNGQPLNPLNFVNY